ncbi:hypothetical protein AG1IA_08848 [Rhizoctonia solani AG-1 IA]|uniref:Uncharacterized protein n=1 Tax=Thanatephorus cucumeris (strain AG1-IA) TaxID=983506 RepID=L8WGP1_THACA|nr:hypothetical protein AG1IA_08848 [Rhizoctonia solani AG-1 IA]
MALAGSGWHSLWGNALPGDQRLPAGELVEASPSGDFLIHPPSFDLPQSGLACLSQTTTPIFVMVDHPGWYPPGQVCYPPELPSYLKNVHNLKPIVGVPSGDELVGIHSVIQAAVRASSIPGMHDAGLFTQLGDHLFSAQMAVYRSKYTSLLFPSVGAQKSWPWIETLLHTCLGRNVHASNTAGSRLGKTRAYILRTNRRTGYQSSRGHSFLPEVLGNTCGSISALVRYSDGYMIQESKRKPNMTQAPGPARTFERAIDTTEEPVAHDASNNAGARPESPQISTVEIRDILERSNAIAERANELSERSNQLIERSNQLAEQSNRPVEKPDESKDVVALRFNELLTKLVRFFDQSNQLAKEAKKPMEELGDIFKTINKVLVRIQHSIIRNNEGNTKDATRCLINEKGDMPVGLLWDVSVRQNNSGLMRSQYYDTGNGMYRFSVNGQNLSATVPDSRLSGLLRFYGIEGDLLANNNQTNLKGHEREEARKKMNEYWSSALGL